MCSNRKIFLKGSRIYFNAKNIVIVDVNGFTERIRIIAIYWPAGQTRNLEQLESYIIENTIITGDFNASIKECGSASSGRRDRNLKEWVEKKRSFLHSIDFIFFKAFE
jgi:hypothetical protein